MTDYIDCLFVGTNRMNVKASRNSVMQFMGEKHPGFRYLNVDMIEYKDDLWLIDDLYNHLVSTDDVLKQAFDPLSKAFDFNTAIVYLGTYLKRRGYTFDYVTSFQEGKSELAAKLKNNRYRAIALTTTFNLTPYPIGEIVQFVRENCDTPIIAGGVFVAQLFNSSYRNTLPMLLDTIGADYYVNSYQGEATLVRFLDALKNNTATEAVPNLCYKSGDTYVETAIVPENNLLSENMVDWSLFADDLKYHAVVRTSVSCKFRCSFCTYHIFGGKFQSADIKGIEYELNQLKQAGVTWITFTDDTFNIPKERFKDILKMMLKNNYGFKWGCFYRCQFADEETLALMRESGCQLVFLGLESGNNDVLKNMNKGVTVERYRAGMDLIKKAGLYTVGSFIFGFPGETMQSISETIELIKETDFYMPNMWIYSPEAPIAKRMAEFGLSVENALEWTHDTMDSTTAADMVEYAITTINESARVPMFDMDMTTFSELFKRGISLDRVKQFIILFNRGLRERFYDQPNSDSVNSAVNEMRDLLRFSITA